MKRYVADTMLCYVTYIYEVDVAEGEDAVEVYLDGDYTYKGFVVGDASSLGDGDLEELPALPTAGVYDEQGV